MESALNVKKGETKEGAVGERFWLQISSSPSWDAQAAWGGDVGALLPGRSSCARLGSQQQGALALLCKLGGSLEYMMEQPHRAFV